MSKQDIMIRHAGPGDLQTLLELYRHLNPDDPAIDPARASDRFSAILAQPGMTIFVALAGDMPVASATLIISPNLTRNGASYALVENVVTHADHRRKGYAGALIRHACATAWKENCYKVMLLTGSRNPATLLFYENCGFMRDKTGYQIRRPG
ncbi:GCN5-related N-acetyltransferase protein [Rhizobium etli 8C-3]|uniref:Acetyltransferase (GNAT) family protein n=2 Tax=Rhizobium TaxID=379 RepID=A0A4R3QV34_9HYPH|nr:MULTISPECIES: GNAT family N-acetyltransferase [Rhizobium]APO75527.1 GCN5-related N-acetyltransferase protein [Rhizobium etli 8C-3]TCU25384.1 acetyltransferase (GNAT) family protein [Rhizobium azibense]TCU40329.1 acetyltransferase (GNAT) family protein [Rhizobium azibense]